MESLPLLDGDGWGEAFGIDAFGVAVGRSCGAAGCRAVLRRDGAVASPNRLIGPGHPHRLTAARAIDDSGRITGNLVQQGTGRNLPSTASPIAAP